jgi:hypothetical protein
LIPGTVLAGSDQYQDVLIKYDLQSDKLLYLHYTIDGDYTIELLQPSVSGFTIGGHTFIFLDEGPDDASMIKPGYYEILYNGRSHFIKKWSKFYLETDIYPYYKFDESQVWYVGREGKYFRSKSLRDIYELFPDKKQEIRSFIKEHCIRIRSADEQDMVDVLNFADQLYEAGK